MNVSDLAVGGGVSSGNAAWTVGGDTAEHFEDHVSKSVPRMFNGDTDLAITGMFGIARLCQPAFPDLKDLARGRSQEPPLSQRRKLTYRVTVARTSVGWAVVGFMRVPLALAAAGLRQAGAIGFRGVRSR